ncbi:aryl-alcohol dehydrogenase-like predicted oxidoreductase [Rhodovulum imhoffii]|uniref:Aryl-alcohol dehydrogenase-like predicted oxidoreductase n=1 Tax=Rhodovulum imhoffii TaxID=365340 RepID=A0A2T5BQW7_9RHOB|nr:aldo/keto reductase [Rhodovulum imhoffii]MBK5932581.1 aldo/keto reductase [Rhodovulum imhoffii]PTN01636.1 aryl-alcohol dehydrogenase-like predicted oxidoreductase [Rhodovulum imhoffii]
MKQLQLGQAGPTVSALCLGTMTWGSQNSAKDAFAQLDRAVEHGITFADTAEMYPVAPVRAETVGRTEEILGDWLARSGRRGDLVLATKITGANKGFVRDGAGISPQGLVDAVEGSLRRLKTDVIDLYQLHWPNRGSYHFRQNWGYDPSGQNREETLSHMAAVLETLQRLVEAGKIRHFGLSNETAWGMAQWLRLAEGGGPRPVSLQNEYSLLCRQFDTDLAELAVNEGVTLLAYSPLAAGLLSGKYAGDVTPEGTRRARVPDLGGRITPRVWEAVSTYLGIAKTHGLDPVQMAIAFVRSRPAPTVPIVGATSLAQLDTVLESAGLVLAPEVLAEIDAAHKAHPLPF